MQYLWNAQSDFNPFFFYLFVFSSSVTYVKTEKMVFTPPPPPSGLKSISEVRVPHDQKTPSLSIDQGFAVDIHNQDVFSESIESEYDVNCYTDGSKIIKK